MYYAPAIVAKYVSTAENPQGAKIYIEKIKSIFDSYISAGTVESFEEDIPLLPGIRAMETPGHTQGHTSYYLESRGQVMIVLGDLVHEASLQLPNPWAAAASDADPKMATSERIRVLELAAAQGYWLAGAHLSFPGIGHVRHQGGGFRWIPADYDIPK